MSRGESILLVEDDVKLAKFVIEYLKRNRYNVDWVTNGQAVINKVQSQTYDLILLDVMLPGKSGFDVCRELRKQFVAPIVMLTARTNDFDHIRGLEAGADDYIYKPVEPLVLLARIKMHMRRSVAFSSQTQDKDKLSFGDLKIDLRSHTVFIEDASISLTEGEFELLRLLAINAGQTMSREDLFELVIGRPYDGLDRTVDGRISRIRRKLDCTQEAPKYIKAIRGKGYLFFAQDDHLQAAEE